MATSGRKLSVIRMGGKNSVFIKSAGIFNALSFSKSRSFGIFNADRQAGAAEDTQAMSEEIYKDLIFDDLASK